MSGEVVEAVVAWLFPWDRWFDSVVVAVEWRGQGETFRIGRWEMEVWPQRE